LKKDTQILLKQTSYGISELYDKYAGMLLGYIYDIVKDSQLAEQHLVNIYSALPTNYHEFISAGENTWCYLQRLAKKHLLDFTGNLKSEYQPEQIDHAAYNNRNKFLKLMSHEQKQVFCGIYHYGKTISQLATALNRSEDFIRKTLKEAFVIIRKTV
jgi:DNA-directed RNA polymerase specialized sigma24 family protein